MPGYPSRVGRQVTISLVAVLLLSVTLVVPEALFPRSVAESPRLVLAFYYAWFDVNTWSPAKVPDLPLEPYASSDPAAIRRHVEQAQSAGIDAFVQSWWGFGNPTDDNFKILLDVAAEKGFRATIDFEVTSPFYRGRGDVVESLRGFMQSYGGHPALLRWQGKPVLFFWRQQQYDLATWKAIRAEVDPAREWIWIAEGVDVSYQQIFDGHHLYSVAWSPDPAGQLRKVGGWMRDAEAKWGERLWVATAMPGYNDTRTGRANAFVRDRAGGAYYRASWQGAGESGADWVIITSWNEWPEGTYIEPSQAYGDTYLALTRELSASFKAGAAEPAGSVASAAPSGGAVEWTIPAGRFFTQTGGDQGGFAVTDDGQARFWSEFRRLGGVQALGYPISRRFERDAFVTQAFQKAILQWRPDEGRAVLINVFDELSRAGKDGELAERFQTPWPLPAGWDGDRSFAEVVSYRQALLDANEALKRHYFSVADPLTFFGLPTSEVADQGSHYAIRLQRAVLQQWKTDVPWARAGEVTAANGGDLARQLGWLPEETVIPEPVN